MITLIGGKSHSFFGLSSIMNKQFLLHLINILSQICSYTLISFVCFLSRAMD